MIFNEGFTNGFIYELSISFSIISLSCGICILISKNPIMSVLYLIGLFLSIAGYLMILGMNFIGLSYILVYVGAVSILFLFILMLINVRISELQTENRNSIPLAFLIVSLFSVPLIKLLPLMDKSFLSSSTPLLDDNLHYATSQIWDGVLAESSHITSIGSLIYTVYPLWFILTSIILLLGMVGAIVITIKQE